MQAPRATAPGSSVREWTCAPRAPGRRSRAALRLVVSALTLFSALGSARGEATVLLLGASGEPGTSELSARIRGQTQDLALTLAAASASPPITADAARASASHRGAQIVVWSEVTGPARLTVHVLDVDSGELRTRSVSTSQRETLASSTTAEMAALVVRSELSALLAERTARDTSPSFKEPSPAPAPAAAKTLPARVAPAGHGSWWLGLGYRPSLPIRDELAHGLSMAGRRELGKLVLGLAGHVSLPITLSDRDARIRVVHGAVRAEALRAATISPTVRLLFGGALGVTLTGRSTRSAQRPLVGEADALRTGATVGLLTELHWQWSEQMGLALGMGVNGVLWRTKFAYALPRARRQLGSLARFEPWMFLGFFARFGGLDRGR